MATASTVLLALAAGLAAADAPPARKLSPEESLAAAAFAESAIDRYARNDWAGLRAMLTPEAARDDPDTMLGLFQSMRELLGDFSYGLLAAPIKHVSAACHERRYVLAHQRHAAHLSLEACGSGEDWKIGHMEIVPSSAAHASRLVRQVMAEKLGVEFFEPVCRDAGKPAGAELACWASTHGGDTLDVRLARTESGLSVTALERDGKAPAPTREV